MPIWTLTFGVITLISGSIGFGASSSGGPAKIVFFVSFALFVGTLVGGLARQSRRRATDAGNRGRLPR